MEVARKCVRLAMLSSAALSSTVLAQTPSGATVEGAQATDAGAAPEILVTAQRRSQRLQDVPVSVLATTGTELQRANITGLEAVAIRAPAVRIAVAPLSDFIAIRGVGSSLNLGFEQSVATFVDGIYRGRSRSTRAALFDIEQVEILKGPQTTFFGNNAIAGAFNITTRKPGDAFQIDASAFFAPDTSEYTLQAGVDAPLGPTLSARLAGQLSGTNGYLENDNLGKDSPHSRGEIARVSLHWEPSSRFETQARLEVNRQRDRRSFDIQILRCPPDAAFGPPRGTCARYLAISGGAVDDNLDNHTAANDSFFNFDYYELAQTSSIDLGAANAIFTTGYYDHDYDLLTDVNPVPAARGGSIVNTTQVTPARFRERYHQLSQEVRLQSNGESSLDYMVGAYFAKDRLAVTSHQGFYMAPFGSSLPFYNAGSPIAFRIENRQRSRTASVFGSLTFRPVSVIRINAGIRYSSVTKRAHRAPLVGTAGSIPSGENFVAAPGAIQTSLLPILGVDLGDYRATKRTDNKLLPTASIQYDVSGDVMTYASYSKGFKAGGFSGYTSASVFGPEEVNAFELGVKSRLLDGALTLNMAAFLQDYKGLQEATTVLFENGSQMSVVGNVAGSRSKGVELSAVIQLAQGLRLSSDLSYLDARYTDYINAPCTPLQALGRATCVQDLSGKRRAFAPKYSGSLSLEYSRPITSTVGIRLNGLTYFTSRFFQQPIAYEPLSQSGYAKIDLSASLLSSDRSWEVSVIAKNVTDKLTASYRQVIPTATGSVAGLQEQGRSIGVRVSVKY